MSKFKEYLKENRFVLAVFVVLSVLEIAVIFPLMYEDYMNYDSSYQYALTQHSIPEIIKLLPYDYSPPFYALALKLYTMVFGNTLQVMRSFSVFAVVGMLFVGAFPMKTLFGKRSSVLCMIITFCSGAMLKTLHEIRPTLFAMFFLMAAAVYAAAAYSMEKKYMYVCFTVFSVLSMYTHNVALVSVFSIYIVLLVSCLLKKNYRKMRNFFISGVICAVLYIPWLGVIFSQISAVNDYFWEATATLSDTLNWVFGDIFLTYSNAVWALNIARAVVMLVMLGLFFAFLSHINFKTLKNAKTFKEVIAVPAEKSVYSDLLMVFSFLAATLMILELINIYFRNLASTRYCYIMGMIWVVLFSAMLGQLGNKIYNRILAAVLLVFNAVNVYCVKLDLDSSDFLEMKEYIYENTPENEICFLHSHEFTLGIMCYYFPNATHYVCDETFTVLRTYDVFPTNVVDTGAVANIWNYTDSCYIFTDDVLFNNIYDTYATYELLETLGNNEITDIRTYIMGYPMSSKVFPLALAEYTGEKNDPAE